MLEGPEEELEKRCTKAGQDIQLARGAAAADGVPATTLAATHYNATDQARRLATYNELRAQDELDLEYLVRLTNCSEVHAQYVYKGMLVTQWITC